MPATIVTTKIAGMARSYTIKIEAKKTGGSASRFWIPLARGLFWCSRTHCQLFLDTCRLAGTIAQVIELGATH